MSARLRAGIHRVPDEGGDELLCGFEWDGGDVKIVYGKDSDVAQCILKVGLVGNDYKTYTLKDGEAFMRQVPWAYTSMGIMGDIWEEKDGGWVRSKRAPWPEVDEQGEPNA